MFLNYFKIAWRNLVKDKTSSIINIGGLAVGMAVTFLIGMWVYDELNFNKSFANYDRIAQLMQHQTSNGSIATFSGLPLPLGKELQTNYGNNFKYVVMASWRGDNVISASESNLAAKTLSRNGIFMDADAPKMLSLHMLQGTQDGLKDPNSILLSSSTAKAFFGDQDPINKSMHIGNQMDVKVTGVFEDLPFNTEFNGLDFIAPWNPYINSAPWLKRSQMQWDNNSFQIYVQLADNIDPNTVDRNIIHSKQLRVDPEDKKYNSQVFLHPMSDWHLKNHWENGQKEGGAIEYVHLFSIIGAFVLLLACINFMNLSTARSEKRAKEVGIRKAIGSLRSQLIAQFYIESLLIVLLSFALSILLVWLILPWFNEIANKKMVLPWTNPFFWMIGLGISVLAGIIAGSYPALYLSSFQPIKVLKNAFRAGRWASLPRKALVVTQFSVSIALIIGTVIVYDQILYSRNRPIGYNKNGLMMIQMKTPEFYGNLDLLRNELRNSGAVTEVTESSSPLTDLWQDNNGFSWPGKDPNTDGDFGTVYITSEFGKAVAWQLKEGRDFSRDFKTDSSAIILNESAEKFMGLKQPIGTMIKWGTGDRARSYKVIGVIKDLLVESPNAPVRQTIYFMNPENVNWIVLKLNKNSGVAESIATISSVFKTIIPSAPFDYKFADKEFASKFAAEERIGKLSTFFAALAIFISCLGLFGLASFVAEQRTKEIGVRKVLGASVFSLWRLLSKEFVLLVLLSLVIATPITWYFMHQWLLKYPYRTDISWWVFGISGIGAIALTLLTVSYQSIKAALANPVNSLRSE